MACVTKRRGRWVLDFRDENGRRHWETYRTKKGADDALTEIRKDLKDGNYVDPGTLPTVAEVAGHWLNLKRDHPASSVNVWQTQIERHLIPAFGPLRIDQLSPAAIERLRNQKRDGDTDGSSRLARATINQLLQTLTAICDYAVGHGLLRTNPGLAVKRVREQRQSGTVVEIDPKDVLTAAQAGRLIEAADPGLYRTFIKTALLTGCRRGELLGLTWAHVDLEAGTLKIRRSLSWAKGTEKGYGKSVAVFGPPKTRSSARTLDLAPELVHDLRVWKLQSRYKRDEDLVFPNSLGNPLHGAFLNKGLAKALAASKGLPRVDLHGLRHSFASILIGRGVPVTQVSRLLGHKNPDLTLKVYSHWFRGESAAPVMAELAGAILGGPERGSKVVAVPEIAGLSR